MILFGHDVGVDNKIFAIAGPCALEDEGTALAIAHELKRIAEALEILIIFKGSFDKANRTSHDAFRGPGLDEGLKILLAVRRSTGLPVVTDIHEASQARIVSEVVDMIQIPAFLCRQTDLLLAASDADKPIHIKKGTFLSAADMQHAVDKIVIRALSQGRSKPSIVLCERGNFFGYKNLVADMRNLIQMRETGCPITFDMSHSVQLPGAGNGASTAEPQYMMELAQAATGCGISGLFFETHPEPSAAKSDGASAWPLERAEELLKKILRIDAVVKGYDHGNISL